MSEEVLRALDERLTQQRREVLLDGMVPLYGTSAQRNVCKSSMCLPLIAIRQQGHALRQEVQSLVTFRLEEDCVCTHLTKVHELAYDREGRSIRIDSASLFEELRNGLERVQNQYAVPQSVKVDKVPCVPIRYCETLGDK